MLHEEDQVTDMSPAAFEDLANQQHLAVAGTQLRTALSHTRQALRAHLDERWVALLE